MSEIWCNGLWLPADPYPGAAQDRGAFLGLGLFETMSAIDGRLVFADRHLSRLRQSCDRLGWAIDLPDLNDVSAEICAKNSLTTGHARIRLIVTAGSGPLNDLSAGADRLVWFAAFPAAFPPTKVTACLAPWPRNERSPLAGLKTACYAENLIALDHARRLGYDEAIFLNTAGHLCEAATANLFLVKNGILLTPSLASGCLPGIGREVLLELAAANGISCHEAILTLADLEVADEIFLISATRGPFPVVRLDGREIEPGPVTLRLRQLWNEITPL